MLTAIIGLILAAGIGVSLMWVGGLLRQRKSIIARVSGLLISIYGAVLIAASLYGLSTL